MDVTADTALVSQQQHNDNVVESRKYAERCHKIIGLVVGKDIDLIPFEIVELAFYLSFLITGKKHLNRLWKKFDVPAEGARKYSIYLKRIRDANYEEVLYQKKMQKLAAEKVEIPDKYLRGGLKFFKMRQKLIHNYMESSEFANENIQALAVIREDVKGNTEVSAADHKTQNQVHQVVEWVCRLQKAWENTTKEGRDTDDNFSHNLSQIELVNEKQFEAAYKLLNTIIPHTDDSEKLYVYTETLQMHWSRDSETDNGVRTKTDAYIDALKKIERIGVRNCRLNAAFPSNPLDVSGDIYERYFRRMTGGQDKLSYDPEAFNIEFVQKSKSADVFNAIRLVTTTPFWSSQECPDNTQHTNNMMQIIDPPAYHTALVQKQNIILSQMSIEPLPTRRFEYFTMVRIDREKFMVEMNHSEMNDYSNANKLLDTLDKKIMEIITHLKTSNGSTWWKGDLGKQGLVK